MAESGAGTVPSLSSLAGSKNISSEPPLHEGHSHQRPEGGRPRRLAALLLARKDQLLRGRRRRGSSCSSCGRNTLSLSDSESLAGSSKRSHDTISRNSSSGQSATTLQTLISSPHRDARYSDKRLSRYEDLGDDNVIDGLQVIAEREMNSFQRHMPGLQRHDIKTSTIRQHYYPEGTGGWGWVVCGCVFAIHVLTSGLQFSFGVLYTDLAVLVGPERALQACWVGATCLAVSRASSPFVVALCRRKSTRLTAVIGGLVMALAILFTSFALHLHQVFLSWALVLGVGIGMTKETANLMLGQYFKRKREFVEIIAQSGCGVGITLFSVFFKETIRSVGWRLGLQAVTGAVFSAFFLGIFYRSASLYHPQRRAILHLKNQKKKQVKDKKKPGEKPPYFDVSSLKMRSVQVILIATALVSAGVYAPLFFLIMGAQEEGMEDSALILLQTFLGFAYALGCIGVGVIVVRRSSQCLISRQYLCQGSFLGLGITILSLTAVKGYYGYVLFMWLYGLQLGGAHYSIKMLTLEKVRARQFSRAWGFIQGGTALPILFGVPITGYINASSPKTGYFFSSFLTIIGGASLFLLNVFRKQINAPPDTTVSFTTVDSHLPPDPPSFPVPLENGGNGAEASVCRSQLPMPIPIPIPIPPHSMASVPYRDPICTCGADPCATVPHNMPPSCHPPNMDVRRIPPHKGWGKNISFASSVDVLEPRHELVGCMSDEALFERYYDYMADCTTTCNNKLDNFFAFSDFERGCGSSLDGSEMAKEERWRQRVYSPCQQRTFPPGRRLKQSSGVSFSEPEGLARLGQYPQYGNFTYVCPQAYGPNASEFQIPPVPRPPCLRGSLPRPRRSVTLVEEITTSV